MFVAMFGFSLADNDGPSLFANVTPGPQDRLQLLRAEQF